VVKHVDAAELRVVAAAVTRRHRRWRARRTPPSKTWCTSGYRTGLL
jgi:hypothetical protein